MKPSPSRLGRPPLQRDRALTVLRSQIISGELASGERLPARLKLEKTLRVDTRTLEDTIQQLRMDGFIESQPRGGTFIAAHPPHVSNFALTFPSPPELVTSQFYRALRAEAEKLQEPEQRFSLFYNIEARHDLPDYQQLLGLIQRHALAGVIYAARPWGLWDDPILVEPGVPRVMIDASLNEPGVPSVFVDNEALLPRAFEWLAGRKHRRVAVLSLAMQHAIPSEFEQVVRATATRYGLQTQTRWIQATPRESSAWATNQVASMLHGPANDRPDALVITDDNLVPAATAGILAAGGSAQIAKGLEVVAHANFPHITPSAVPAQRLGFDVRHILGVCVERLLQLRRGETPPALTLVPVLREEDVQISTC